MNNPWYDEKNPYMSGKPCPALYGDNLPIPLFFVLDGLNRPVYNPDRVVKQMEELDEIACRYLEIGRTARERWAYLQWRHWEETHK